MLKPEQIKTEEFELSVLGGYKREQVDTFFDNVYTDYEKLYSENAELVQKLKICVSKIEEYQKDEQFLKAAIINAEKLNETSLRDIEEHEKQVIQAAKEKADNIVETARLEAEDIVKTARLQAADSIRACEIETAEKIALLNANVIAEQEKFDAIKKEVSEFKDNVLKLYKKHLDSLSKLPDYIHNSSTKNQENEPAINVMKDDVVHDNDVTEVESISEETDKELSSLKLEKDKINLPERNIGEETAEFILEKKDTLSEQHNTDDTFERNFKFSDLKFGADFDIKKDK